MKLNLNLDSKISKRIICGITGAVALAILFVYVRYVFNLEKVWKYNGFVGIGMISLFFGMGYLCYLIVTGKKYSYEKLWLILAFTFSISMQLIMTPFSGPDEIVHFMSSYNASDVYMGMFKDYDSFYMRAEDNKLFEYDVRYPDSYEMLADGNWFGTTEESEQLFTMDFTWMYWYRFLFTGAGITVARWLHLGNVGLMYMGRFFNTLFMILVGWICVKLAPYGKAQIVSFSMFPLMMELANSYSYDVNTIMGCLLFAVLCMHYAQEETRFRFVDVCILTAVLAFLLPNKTVYVVMGLMVFVIPLRKWIRLFWDKNKKLIWNLINLACLLVFIYIGVKVLKVVLRDYSIITFIHYQLEKTGVDIETMPGREAFSIKYMMENPGHTWQIFLTTIFKYGWTDFKYGIGQFLGHHTMTFESPVIFILIIIAACFAMLFIGRKDGAKGVGARKFSVWVVTEIVLLGGMLLGCLLRFTPIEGTERIQISYRYYIPVIIIGFMMTGTNRKENRETLVALWAESIGYVSIMTYCMYHLITI